MRELRFANIGLSAFHVPISKSNGIVSIAGFACVNPGMKTGTFIISHSAVQITSIVNVKATYNSITATANLLVTP